ncbi:MAG: aspartate/glutamate racemase family protein, partial [Candidatus Krumholzibacteria bacterium]|nr:aspartate/glutamate racemase family protein [Candidatus Krumholzibacteria bacterium]
GGMSWESSLEYYRIINQRIKERLGGLHSAKIIMYSFDFAEIEHLQHGGRWDEAGGVMIEAARLLENAGADLILICTNTMHKMADDVQKSISVPLLHIADATAERLKEMGLRKAGLLGTRFTMEEDFYKGRLKKKYGIEVVIPDLEEREKIHRVIYDELCVGETKDASRQRFIEIINNLISQGAEGVILGCTEIPLLVKQEDVDLPLFDTTMIHASRAADISLS